MTSFLRSEVDVIECVVHYYKRFMENIIISF